MEGLVRLSNVLIHAHDYSWGDALFLPEDKNWTLNSSCAVLNMDDLEDDEEAPQFAIVHNLIYALGIHEVHEIVDNAHQQNPDSSEKDLFDAFLYYYKNDAFLPQ